MIVDRPVKLPNGCIRCRSQKGPIYDGGVVTPMELTLYVCRTCAETIAREYGLTEGEEMDRLRDAAAELAQRDKEAAAHAEEIRVLAQALEDVRNERDLNFEALETERGKVATMEHAAADVRQAVGSFAGVGAAEAAIATIPLTKTQDPED